MNLLVFNYSMNPNSLVFGHQREVVIDLVGHFDSVQVVTSDPETGPGIEEVRISTSDWEPGRRILSSYRFLRLAMPILLRSRFSNKKLVIFSYMTEVQSALLAPAARAMGIRHYLWYAHTNKSIFLKWCHFWVTGILTSTADSCPYNDSKVHHIGQAVDAEKFVYLRRERSKIENGVYVGRFDKSKDIESIINFLREASRMKILLRVNLIGDTTLGNEQYFKELIEANTDLISSGYLTFSSKVQNSLLPSLLKKYDFFINSFLGSLDKSLVEATLVGLPVITVNPPYLREFGSWMALEKTSQNSSLFGEFLALLNLKPEVLEKACETRSQQAVLMHSRDVWLKKLLSLLKS